MIHPRTIMACLAVSAAGMHAPAALRAQGQAFDLSYGRWWYEGQGSALALSATWRKALVGPLDYGLGLVHLADRNGLADRTITGGEVSLAVAARGSGPYAVGSVGFGMRHADGNLDALWSLGGGYSLQPLSFVRLGLEARYRVEDSATRGFWQLQASDRRGLLLKGGLSLHFGQSERARPPAWAAASPDRAVPPPTRESLEDSSAAAGAPGAVAARTAAIVETALGVMGTPYRWGGTDQNGFDCSGLIQYAYAQHGIVLPRVSRDQARTGIRVETRWYQLRPGDILGFGVEGSRVTHVGLYVGDGRFIHSASGGVQLSSLTSSDPEDRWWQERWITARRVLAE